MKLIPFRATLAGTGLALTLAVSPALAQSAGPVDRLTQFFGRSAPPADLDDDTPVPVPRADTGAAVRIDRLENRIRDLTGQIEQLQFAMRQLQEQLRNAQPGVQSQPPALDGRPARRSDEGSPAPSIVQATPLPPAVPPLASSGDPSRVLRRGDAFDPTMQPNAPGAPRPIGSPTGTVIPSSPVAQSARPPGGVGREAGVPMDLSGGRLASNGVVIDSPRAGALPGTPLPSGPAVGPIPTAPTPSALPNGQQLVTPGGTIIASREPASPKDEFDIANGYLKAGQFEAAEKGFATFLQKNPKNRLVPEAVFNLGESYFQRGRHTDAAKEYLKISTTYSNSPRAPDALLRLGQSLVAFGGKEQACASFAEIGRKYPNASASVKTAADREAKKNGCG